MASHRKRPRSESNEEFDDDDAGVTGRLPGEDEEEDEDDDSPSTRTSLANAEAGTIKTIDVVNFMCHECVTLCEKKIHPTGGLPGNGSKICGKLSNRTPEQAPEVGSYPHCGKSAVLAALTVCLGATAKATGRGSKAGSLVKHGKSFARVTVKLTNRGPEAYRHDEFGDEITIERRISKEGNSGYKLINAKGHTVSTSSKDLRQMLDQFDIQVDNPCNVLYQDTARQFLRNSKPEVKYQLFMKATQLDQMQKDFSKTQFHLENMERLLAKKEARLPELKSKIDELKTVMDELERIEKDKTQVGILKGHLEWSRVIVLEKEVQGIEERVTNIGEQLKSLKKAKAEAEVDFAKCQEQLEPKLKESAANQEQMQALTNELSQLEANKGVVMREKARRQGNLADLKRRPETLIKRREKVLAHIEAAKNRQAQDTQAEMDEHQQALQRSNEAMTKLREQIGEIDDNIARYTDSLRHIEERLEAATDEMRKNETTKGKTEQSIATLERQMKDKSTVFGARTHEIQALVKQHEKQFSRLPLGPLGMNVVLKDETWAVAVEAACGNVLGTYIVFSSQDEVTLRSILRQANFNPEEMPEITKQNFRHTLYEIPKELQVDTEHTPILRVLQAEHPMVLNVLIDRCKVESRILMKDRIEATALVRTRPRNVTEVYLADGSRIMFKDGNVADESRRIRVAKLSRNNEGHVKTLKEQFKQLVQRAAELAQQRADILRERDDMRKVLDPFKSNKHQLEARYRSLSNKHHELTRNVPQPPPAQNPAEVADLESNLRDLDLQMEQAQQAIAQSEREAAEIDKEIAPIAAQIQRLAEKSEKNMILSETIENEVSRLNAVAQKVKNHVVRLEATIQNAEPKYQAECARLEAANQAAQERAEQVSAQYPDRPDALEDSPESLTRRIAALEARIAEDNKKQPKSLAAVAKEHGVLLTQYKQQELLTTKLKNMMTRLNISLKDRVKRWKAFRKSVARRTKNNFAIFLSQKGFNGALNFDHEAAKLEILVNPDQTRDGSGSAATTSNLSGGESSFTTVSLLLALWTAMESPFRALDEFDVFMDAVNRRISTDMLLAEAKKSGKQFIFITPQDSSGLPAFVRVIKMRPPDRGQATLGDVDDEE